MFPSDRGNVAKPVRMALGSLIIQARCSYTDRETVQQIMENPYLQYFIGFKEFQLTRPFTPVAMVKFRKRFKAERLARINELILTAEQDAALKDKESEDDNHHDNNQNGSGRTGTEQPSAITGDETAPEKESNQGTLILDATCTPADVRYPTDLGLLNEAREKLDEIIDTLHKANGKKTRRPRTYRKTARRAYLNISKQRSPRKNQLHQAIKKQLQFGRRNIRIINRMLEKELETTKALSQRQQNLLETIKKLIDQQETMYKSKSHHIADRIVNLYQSHVRPIVRGKAGAAVKFGAKVAISLENGYSRIEKLSWDAYNEAGTLEESIERYKDRYGYYPEAILADRIYRNRDNIAYCKKHQIRLSGPKLGRPFVNALVKKAEKNIERLDAGMRNAVESKFGEGKRKYGLDRIYARLKDTAECMIAMQFLVMNLEHKLRFLFLKILFRLLRSNNKVNFA